MTVTQDHTKSDGLPMAEPYDFCRQKAGEVEPYEVEAVKPWPELYPLSALDPQKIQDRADELDELYLKDEKD